MQPVQRQAYLLLQSLLFTKGQILNWSKFKAFTEDKLDEVKEMSFLYDSLENTEEKEKMLVTSIFSFSYIVIQNLLP